MAIIKSNPLKITVELQSKRGQDEFLLFCTYTKGATHGDVQMSITRDAYSIASHDPFSFQIIEASSDSIQCLSDCIQKAVDYLPTAEAILYGTAEPKVRIPEIKDPSEYLEEFIHEFAVVDSDCTSALLELIKEVANVPELTTKQFHPALIFNFKESCIEWISTDGNYVQNREIKIREGKEAKKILKYWIKSIKSKQPF